MSSVVVSEHTYIRKKKNVFVIFEGKQTLKVKFQIDEGNTIALRSASFSKNIQ